jgi:hypothetical protein
VNTIDTGDAMLDLMLDDPTCPPPLDLVVLTDEEVALLIRVLTPRGCREHLVVTTQAVLDAAGVSEQTARDALAKELYFGHRDYTQEIDLALDPEHLFFAFVDDHTNPKWQNLD